MNDFHFTVNAQMTDTYMCSILVYKEQVKSYYIMIYLWENVCSKSRDLKTIGQEKRINTVLYSQNLTRLAFIHFFSFYKSFACNKPDFNPSGWLRQTNLFDQKSPRLIMCEH